MFAEEFQGRILAFEDNAARAFAHIVAVREAVGLPISQLDAMIAAIARSPPRGRGHPKCR
jgi:toxin FitB